MDEGVNDFITTKKDVLVLYQIVFGVDGEDGGFHGYGTIVSHNMKDCTVVAIDHFCEIKHITEAFTQKEIDSYEKALFRQLGGCEEPQKQTYKEIEYTTEGSVKYHVGFGGDIIPITVTNIETGRTIQKQYRCQQRPIFGHDSLDVQEVERILDDMIKSIQ